MINHSSNFHASENSFIHYIWKYIKYVFHRFFQAKNEFLPLFLGWQIRDTRALEMNYIWPEWWVDFSTVLYVAPLCDSSSSFVDYSCFSLTGNWESVMLFPLQALLQMLGRNGGALAFRWHTCLQLYRAAPHFVSAVEQLDCLLGLAKGNSSASHRQEKKSVSSAIAVQLSSTFQKCFWVLGWSMVFPTAFWTNFCFTRISKDLKKEVPLGDSNLRRLT